MLAGLIYSLESIVFEPNTRNFKKKSNKTNNEMLLQGKAFRKRVKYEFLKAFMRFTLYGDFFIFLLYLFPFFFTFTQIRIIIYLINPR